MTLLIIFYSCLIGFNLVNSRLDAYLITNHKTIAHFINFAAYGVLVYIILDIADYYPWWYAALFCLAAFFNRQVFFDISLNLRRRKTDKTITWDYVSRAAVPAAWFDRQEIKIFGRNGRKMHLIYIGLCIFSASLLFVLVGKV